jgi:acyl-CoA thioester hydrolase
VPDDYSIGFHARWSEMDSNGHLRNAAYLGAAEDCRMRYFDAYGFPMSEFERLRIGPVVLHDQLAYARELRLLERATVTLVLAGLSPDASRFRLRNTVVRERDDAIAAVVTSTGGWLDLQRRRLAAPPTALAELLHGMPHDPEFVELDSSLR